MSETAPDGLLDYYYAELDYLRAAGGEFAQAHPTVAARLQVGAHESPDPHVERLIESFAFLTGRLRRTLEVEVPGISSALLEVLYPQYLNPVPPVTIAELVADPAQGALTSGYVVPRETPLFAQSPDGHVCRFRTCAPVTLHPLKVDEVELEPRERYRWVHDTPKAAQLLRVRLKADGLPLTAQRPERLRFYLGGEMSTAAALYELLTGSLLKVVLVSDDPGATPRILPASALQPAGFGDDEAVLPTPPTAHPAYRLLQEYFTVPRKFLFLELDLSEAGALGAAEHLDLVFVLGSRARERLDVGRANVRLGCTPVVNLFRRLSEPVRVDGRRLEYRLVADGRRERSTEIHSVLGVSAAQDDGGRVAFEPFYSYAHRMDAKHATFWHARRAPAERADLEGTDVFLSFLDLRAKRVAPPVQTVWADVLCTNRRLAEQLLPGDRLHVESALPVTEVRVLHTPTAAVDPPLGGQTQWRLISHLSLNHLSLTGGDEGLEALREILRLYAAYGDPTVESQVFGIRRMETRPAVRRVGPDAWRGFCRGTEIDLLVDEGAFTGGSALLLASVLDRFFGLYAAVNSFTRLSVRRQNREEAWKTWPARVGARPLL
ncbi:MAG TPA: type VI secretion system baseplate subunit TssF [Longimicrobium sp.]